MTDITWKLSRGWVILATLKAETHDAINRCDTSRRQVASSAQLLRQVKAMLREAIFRAPCNATSVRYKLQKKFTYNTPFCNCNCCVARCKKSGPTLYFSQRCETSCLRLTSPQQLATQFCESGPIRAHLSLAGDFKMRPPPCLLSYALQVAKKVANAWHPLRNLIGFLFVLVALQVARKIASCNMTFTAIRHLFGSRNRFWKRGKVN